MKHFVLSLVAAATLCVPTMAQNRVKNIYASAEKLNVEQLQNTEQPVQLCRYLFAGYNTLCLPMSVSAEQLQKVAQGARVERMVGIGQEGNTLNLYFMDCTETGIEAGVPYLIYAPTTQFLRLKNTEATNISDVLKNVRFTDNNGNTISFGSNWETIHQNGLYGIPAKQETTPLQSILIRTDADKAFLPTRCGFNWEMQSTTANDLNIKHINSLAEATGISEVENAKLNAQDATYDLSGRKVNSAKRGIVIQNGKKVMK